jgi:integrase
MQEPRRRSGAWYVRFVDETGKRVERKTSAKSKTEAWDLTRELQRKAERVRLGLDDALEHMTFKKLWEKYEPIAKTKRSWDTLKGRFENHLLPAFGDRLIHQIRAADVEALMAKKIEEGFSPQTADHLRVHVAAIYTFAIKKLRVFKGENPGRIAEKAEIPETEPRFLEKSAVEQLLKFLPDRWRGFFAVGVYTGMRKGEIIGLKVANVDLERRVIVVARSYAGATKSAKVRHVPIIEELVPYLKVELGRARSEYLFPANNGKMRTKDAKLIPIMQRALRRAGFVEGYDHLCRTRGLKKGCGYIERRADSARFNCPTCHKPLEVRAVPMKALFKDLRSTFGTHLTEESGDLRAVQRIMGHSDPKVTERRYAHARAKHLLEIANQLSFQSREGSAPPLPQTEAESKEQEATQTNVTRLRRG